MDMKQNDNTTHVFWTGGMDSTFRVIQLLMTTDRIVQPHYIISSEDSTSIEIDTILTISRDLIRKYPELKSRFLPTIFTNEKLIPGLEEVTEQINELRKKCIVTDQYIFMVNYLKANNIDKIDVAITKEITLHGNRKFEYYRTSKAFVNFAYPILDLSKRDMFRLAKENDWYDLLSKTTFCHRPRKKVSPCGVCGPCNDAVVAGMGFRLPLVPLIKAKLTIPLRKYWRRNYLKQDDTRFFRFIKKKFVRRF